MLHHISFPVSSIEKSKPLYAAILEPLGYHIVCEATNFVGFGVSENEDMFALKEVAEAKLVSDGFHLAFAAPSQKAVDAFHTAALKHGALNNGDPGLRLHYGPTYYAAFAIDLDGHKIEAVCI